MTSIILGLGTYFFPVDALSKQKRVMRRETSKPRGLKVRRYTDSLIDINEYLAVLHGEKVGEMFFMTELNQMFLNSMPNICSKQAHVQGFYF